MTRTITARTFPGKGQSSCLSRIGSGSTVGPIRVPPADTAQVWIDFDGTITRADVLDELIVRYSVDDTWKAIEKAWQSGNIGSFQCLTAEFDLLRVSSSQLDHFLDTIAVDGGISGLLELFQHHSIPVAVLSDGVESFIRRILARIGATHLPVRSNRVIHEQDRLELVCPWRSHTCQSQAAHCKCASAELLQQPGRRTIYIGDGRSDLCPARRADVVFAKGTLARCLQQESIEFIPFQGLSDVTRVLSQSWNEQTESESE